MHYALAKDDEGWYAQHLQKAILFAPCFVASIPTWLSKRVYDYTFATFRQNGIYSLGGSD